MEPPRVKTFQTERTGKSRGTSSLTSSHDLLKSFVKNLKKEIKKDAWYRAIDWTLYLEKETATVIEETRYQKDTLFIYVSSAAFAHEFKYIKEALLVKLQHDFPNRSLLDIRVHVARQN